MTRRRLLPERFRINRAELFGGFYSDKYFVRTRDILVADEHNPEVLMQVFCRSDATLCGIDEAIAVLKVGAKWESLNVSALYDGDHISPWETVMTIQGPYAAFAHLETVYLGVLARGTRVATHTRDIVNAANGKDVLFFGARHDHYLTQRSDGYAAVVGGAAAVASDAQGTLSDLEGVGTIPHAMIAAYQGDTVRAAQRFIEHMPNDVGLVALVDFDNDCVGTSLAVAEALGDKLTGVRLDTSASLIDRTLEESGEQLYGVNPVLVNRVRESLDAAGFDHVRIVVSGGMNQRKINEFESQHCAVDAYGVGSSILSNEGRFDFTADIVEVNGEPVSKVGRELKPNHRLEVVQ